MNITASAYSVPSKIIAASIAYTLSSLTAFAVHAESAEEKGRQIMLEVEARDEGWQDGKTNLVMILRKPDGREVVRKITSQALEGESGKDKSIIEFEEPLDVRGTMFLTHSHPLEPDDQWIFLPALKRTKRISSKRQTGRFMGSEFSYEDMAAFSIHKYTYKYLGDAPCGEAKQDCYIVESYPVNKYSGYEKVISYIDKEHYRPHRHELYSKRTGKHQKTLSARGYQRYLNKIWRPDVLMMKNEQTGDETELQFTNQQYAVGVRAADFRKSALEGEQ